MLTIASCEGTNKQKEVEKTADNVTIETVADSTNQSISTPQDATSTTFATEEGKAWLFRHVEKSLKANVTDANPSRTVKRMDVNFSREKGGNAYYLVSGNMQNGTEFSYEFALSQQGSDFKIEETDAPNYFFE